MPKTSPKTSGPRSRNLILRAGTSHCQYICHKFPPIFDATTDDQLSHAGPVMSTANAELKAPTGVGSSEFGPTPLAGWVPVAQSETAVKKSSRSSRSEVPITEVKKDSRHYIIFSVDRPGFIGVRCHHSSPPSPSPSVPIKSTGLGRSVIQK